MDILILTAIPEEFSHVEKSNHHVHLVYTGVGKVSATLSACQALHAKNYDLVLNVGTAGSKHLPIGTVVHAVDFVDRDMEKASDFGAIWNINTKELLPPHVLNVIRPSAICNTGDHFVTEYTHSHGDAFDMEVFGEAAVCIRLQKPFFAIKYISDRIGENSTLLWADKLQEARETLEQRVNELLARL